MNQSTTNHTFQRSNVSEDEESFLHPTTLALLSSPETQIVSPQLQRQEGVPGVLQTFSLRLPGNGNLIDSKNTLRSYSTAEFAAIAATNTSAVVHATSGTPSLPYSVEVPTDSNADGSVWTGLYLRVLGVVGSDGTVVTRNAAHDDSVETSSGMEIAQTDQTLAQYSSANIAQPIFVSGADSSAAVINDSNVHTGSANPSSNSVEGDGETSVLAHAYLAQDTESPAFTRMCWIVLLCIAVAVVLLIVAAVIAAQVLSPSIEPDIVPTTSLPTAAPTMDDRAARVTNYINSITLANVTLAVPLQAANDDNASVNATSAEEAALAWLIYNDPLELSPSNDANQFRLRQRYALLTLFLQYQDVTSWTFRSPDNECEWLFVPNCTVVTEQPFWSSVTGINAEGATTSPGSTLPPDLGLLTSLVSFVAPVSGSIPSSFGATWTNLQHFHVSGNATTGSLPPFLGSEWTNLRQFDVSFNAFKGSLPSLLGATWTELEFLTLTATSLKGGLPSSLGVAWTNLRYFDVGSNDLTGSIPSSFGNSWTSLQFVFMTDNGFTGSLPSTFGSAWTNIRSLYLSDNSFTGSLASSFGATWPNLTYFGVNGNALTGNIPSLVKYWNNIEQAYFFDNNFGGSMPDEFCNKTLSTLLDFQADCYEVTCPCCTTCW